MLMLPPVAALVFTVFYLFSEEPRLRSKVVALGLLVIALVLQFGTPFAVAWLAGLLLSVGIAICLSVHLTMPQY